MGAGRGGVSRGEGAATLEYDGDSDTDTSTLDVKRLPPGQAPPREWALVGLRRATPEIDPSRATGAGSNASAGSGRVTWRRRLAPRHRGAVQRFFTGRGKAPPK